ncbi:MAG TPA: SDR family NAD(P)-dependent oxidoreductase [Candidatus Kryptonia bacterium]|nr:SDR family NAD(P)-dependent oxidoreductase [Candidatus Kryptonia bacterium]
MKLAGKVALVTGGGRGIGRGIALALANEGADIAIAEVDRIAGAAQQYGAAAVSGYQAAQATVKEIQALGRRAVAIEADVTQWIQVQHMVKETVAQLGRLDVLVCNAGVVHIAPVEHMPEEEFDLTMAVNVKGVFLSCKAALPVLKQQPGACIINIASVAGKNGAPGMAHYCASKFAVVGFTNSLAKEAARYDVRVNAICPGILRTQMWEYLAETLKRSDENQEASWQRYVGTLIPLARPQTPEDIGQLAVYLATAPNVTGQAINVDGGMELH